MKFLNYFCLLLLVILFCQPAIATKNSAAIKDNIYSLQNSKTVSIPLKEASGVAIDARNGYIFCHNDSFNDNLIFVLASDGTLIKTFPLDNIKNKDWEDITTDSKGTFWIMDSGRAIYEFKTDINANLIDGSIKRYILPVELIGKNIESLDYIPHESKFYAIFKGKGNKIFKFSLGDKYADFIGQIPESLKIKPSGLAHNPLSGNFFIVAFRGHKIVEMNASFNKVINVINLPHGLLPQPEAIGFDKDNNLVVLSEKCWHSLKGTSVMTKFFIN